MTTIPGTGCTVTVRNPRLMAALHPAGDPRWSWLSTRTLRHGNRAPAQQVPCATPVTELAIYAAAYLVARLLQPKRPRNTCRAELRRREDWTSRAALAVSMPALVVPVVALFLKD
jgi:hypothetical protein